MVSFVSFYVISAYKLSIHVDAAEPSRPLQVSHVPQIQGSESIKVSQAIRVCKIVLMFMLVNFEAPWPN